MSALLDVRWVPYDLIRNYFDKTVQGGGFLVTQDDLLRPSEELVHEVGLAKLPYDELAAKIDLTDFRQRPRTPAQKRGIAHGTRDLANVTALWIHQTASLLDSPERFLSVPVQGAIDTAARGVLLHPLRAYTYHANAANRFTIGIEVACRAAGVEGIEKTFWVSRTEKRKGLGYSQLVHEATDEQILSARHLVTYYIEEVERQAKPLRAQGIKVPGIIAIGDHRNSSSSRTSDPGSRLHWEVVEWAIREYGLKRGPVVGSGRLSPTAWTREGAVRYSWNYRGY
jgi:hypothetical protein